MKPPKFIEVAFFHPNTGTFALVTLRPSAKDSPTVRVNVSLRNPRGVYQWLADRFIQEWQDWFARAVKDHDMNRPFPSGWHPCQVEDVPG